MNMYEVNIPGRVIDLDAAASELKGSATITNDNVRRQYVAEISAAALLDIAGSLRAIADEARAAMPDTEGPEEDDDELDTPERGDDFLVVGDRVRLADTTFVGVVEKFGASEGSAWADVRYAEDHVGRTWIENLVRVHDDAAEAEVERRLLRELAPGLAIGNADDEPPAEVILADGSAPAVGGDGLAILEDRDELDDFTPPSALDLLKATEAKPKKGKKK